MDRKKLIAEINEEIAKLRKVQSLLGQPESKRTPIKDEHTGRVTGYIMNPAARARIAQAQKERWARVRAVKEAEVKASIAAKKASTKTPYKKTTTPKQEEAPPRPPEPTSSSRRRRPQRKNKTKKKKISKRR